MLFQHFQTSEVSFRGNEPSSTLFYAVMPPAWGVPLAYDAGTRAIKEEVGDAHGSWVEGGLLTHSSALARSRAAPHGVQPSHNAKHLQTGLRPSGVDRESRQWKLWIAPTTLPRSMPSFWLRRTLPLSKRVLQVANSPSTTAEVFCIQGGASSATFTQPPETPPAVSTGPSSPPPQPSTDTGAGLRPTQDLGVPLPDRENAARPSPPAAPATRSHKHTHTHTPRAPTSGTPSKPERVPGPVVLRAQGAGAVPSQRRRALLYPPTVVASLFPRSRGRRGVGGEGEGEEPRGGRSRAGTTTAGPTLSLAQSTRVLYIGQT